jgi:DNA helicase-2/ATP-dependent DNA helicase PcrA
MTYEEMVEWFACKVCGKPAGLDPNECHSTIGHQNPLCNTYKCCRIKEKSEQQLDYARSGIDKNIFLKACPGSGKTEVVGLKAAYEIMRPMLSTNEYVNLPVLKKRVILTS